MEKEMNEKACYLDIPPGLEDKSSYLQKFVRAPKSDYPNHPKKEKEINHNEIMNATLGK